MYLTRLPHAVQLGQEVDVPETLEHLSPDDENQDRDQIKMSADYAALSRLSAVHASYDKCIYLPQHPAGDLSILGHLQGLLVEQVMTQSEDAPQLPVLRQLRQNKVENR